MRPLLHYDKIHLYAKNVEQDKYTNMIKKFENINHQVGYKVILCSNDEICPVDNLMENQKPLVDYFIQGRHKNCFVIYLSVFLQDT